MLIHQLIPTSKCDKNPPLSRFVIHQVHTGQKGHTVVASFGTYHVRPLWGNGHNNFIHPENIWVSENKGRAQKKDGWASFSQ